MTSRTSKPFRNLLAALPEPVRRQARAAYRRFRDDPSHPGLQFKKVHPTLPIYSARVSLHYRAVGSLTGDMIVWYWIGTRAEYGGLLARF